MEHDLKRRPRIQGLCLQRAPTRHRALTHTLIGPDWAALLEVFDAPPPYFDVPALDLQPKLLSTLVRGLLTAPLNRPEGLIEAAKRAHEALRGLIEGPQAVLYAGSGAHIGLICLEGDTVHLLTRGRVYVHGWRSRRSSLLNRPDTLEHAPGWSETPALHAARGIITAVLGRGGPPDEVITRRLNPGEHITLANFEPQPHDPLSLEGFCLGVPHDAPPPAMIWVDLCDCAASPRGDEGG
ncbi:hypothetical protein KKF91_11585 [Myxococcota bacterium]|nr:hypothetical protein [Myxococcota bacterium]